jgi:hypothetical protein
MDEKPKPPWNSRERRWNLRWWHYLVLLALMILWGVLDGLLFGP